MLEKIIITIISIAFGVLIIVYFVALWVDMKNYDERKEKAKQEAIELRIKNARLEEKLKALDDEQAKQTKKIAEKNGIGG